MRRPRSLGLACAVAVFLVACASHQTELRTALTTLNAARDGFVAWDDAHQTEIVRVSLTLDQGKADLASYRKRREPIVAGFGLAYKMLATAALAPDAGNLILLAADLADLKAELTALGVTWPGGS